jgi:HNH endonuclease/AP2 domain
MAISLTAARLREVLDYNPKTGHFTWRATKGGLAIRGVKAGWLQPHGYRRITIDRKSYYAARLAVLWMTGSWPRKLVDHKNCIRDDDRWSNIREATHSQNHANTPLFNTRQGKLKGTCWDKLTGRYIAQIGIRHRNQRRNIFLGRFNSEKAAHAAYVAAAKKHCGKFARAK